MSLSLANIRFTETRFASGLILSFAGRPIASRAEFTPNSTAAPAPAICSPAVCTPALALSPKYFSENVLVSLPVALTIAISALFLAVTAFSLEVIFLGPSLTASSLRFSTAICFSSSLILVELFVPPIPKNPDVSLDLRAAT